MDFESQEPDEMTDQPGPSKVSKPTEESKFSRSDKKSVILPFRFIPKTQRRCFICHEESTRFTVKPAVIAQVWLSLRIIISKSNRVCEKHFESNKIYLNDDALQQIENMQHEAVSEFKAADVTEFIEAFTIYTINKRGRTVLDFSEQSDFDDESFTCLFGIDKQNFNSLMPYIADMRTSKNRTDRNAMAMFLLKLRQNISLEAIGCLFGTNRFVVQRAVDHVLECLVKSFVPKHLGYGHVKREDYIGNYTTEIAKALTGANNENAVVPTVLDGTYFYTQKSENFLNQKKTYSPHKYRNLFKAMMIVSSTGHILAVEGFYFADGSNNDASILTNMANAKNGFMSYFSEGDVIIYDRGFRDADNFMQALGFQTMMPHMLKKGQKQHSDLEANESRFVSKLRFVVESANGRIKNVFKFFRDTIPNIYAKENKLWKMFTVACALLNAFFPELKTDTEQDNVFIKWMLGRVTKNNFLSQEIDRLKLKDKRPRALPLTEASLSDFPILTVAELRMITCGVYQIGLAEAYAGQHISEEDDIEIRFHKFEDVKEIQGLCKFYLHSRFSNSAVHKLWISYDGEKSGWEAITGWTCDCPPGLRTVGCCAHIAAVIWYLSHGRYLENVKIPARNLFQYIRDAKTFVYPEDVILSEKLAEQLLGSDEEIEEND